MTPRGPQDDVQGTDDTMAADLDMGDETPVDGDLEEE